MVKKEYRIVILQAGPDESVILGLVPAFALRSEEAERIPNPEKILVGPALQSEDAKMGTEMVRGMMNEVFAKFEQAGVPIRSMASPPVLFPIPLSKQEYEQLGKPTPNEIITLTLTLERAPICSEAAQQETG